MTCPADYRSLTDADNVVRAIENTPMEVFEGILARHGQDL